MICVGPNGLPTEEWMTIRGLDSDAFQCARRVFQRNCLTWVTENGPEKRGTPEFIRMANEETIRMQCSLISNWSFEEPCTPENIWALLSEAPYLVEQIDEFASKRVRFSVTSPNDSANTPKENLASTSPSVEATSPSAST